MDAFLRAQVAVGVAPLDRDRHRFDPGFFAFGHIDHFGLVAALLGPAQVHAHQHRRPVLRVGPASSGVDRQQSVALVVSAGEHRVELFLVDDLFQLSGFNLQFRANRFIVHFRQLTRVGEALCQSLPALDPLAQAGDVLH